VIDVPVDDADATAAPLDEITLTVAHEHSDRDLVSQSFARGEPLELAGAPFGDDLVLHVSGFVGASNVAYGRSCAFEVAPGGTPPAPHVFFSRSVKFASLGIAPVTRLGGAGISYLTTGLLVGGDDERGDPVSKVERFDPLSGGLTVLGEVAPRDGAVQALIGSSPQRVVVIGGASGADPAKFIEVIDDHGVDRLDFADMARVGLTATSLSDGRVMVIGGRPPGPPGQAPSGEIDEIAQDGPSLDVRKLAATLAHPRAGHTATRLGDDVGAALLIAGGVDASGAPIDAAELFKPLSEELSPTFQQKLKIPRSRHIAALMPDGSVLIIGGIDALGRPVATLELFSIDGGFVEVGDLPATSGLVDLSAATLPDGRILITGGRTTPDGAPVNSANIIRLDPIDGRVDVVATDHLAIARAGHQSVVLCDGTVLVTGGSAGQFPAERYNPPLLGRR
jgi:hypothetical protein